MQSVYVLSLPWAHFDTESDVLGIGRRKLSTNEPVKVPAGSPVWVTAPSGAEVQLSGHRMGVQYETPDYALGETQYRLGIASVGTKSSENDLTVRLDGEVVGSIFIDGHFPRPSWSASPHGGGPTSRWGEQVDLFLLGLIDLVRIVDEPTLQFQSRWQRVSKGWSTGAALSEPPMALIVRHAESLHRLLTELESHLRKVLHRSRELTPVSRVQQLDIDCIRWLSRQPGKTIYQRAGPRQRIRSVQRYEDENTLENRVLRDFSQRSARMAQGYTDRYENLSTSLRWNRVNRYRSACSKIGRNLLGRGIALLQPPVVPNYVLLNSPRYRRLWDSYLELLKQIDEEDECWRWQHRLWADFVTLLIHVSLRDHPNVEVIAESPLRISAEQQRGKWALVDPLSGVFAISTKNGHNAVLSFVRDLARTSTTSAEAMLGLGATSLIYVQDVDTGVEGIILIWPIHSFATKPPDLGDVVGSAQRALTRCVERVALEKDVALSVKGLVLMSCLDQLGPIPGGAIKRKRDVIGYSCKSAGKGLKNSAERISQFIMTLVDELLSGPEA